MGLNCQGIEHFWGCVAQRHVA